MTTTETPAASAERHEFQAEARQVLDLMIHSVYSDRDVFLRELLSNASDALDKRRFEALTHPEIAPAEGQEPHIRLSTDETLGTLTIEDDGLGMSREEVVRYLGTIARSGTGEFAKALRDNQGSSSNASDLIGRFGVGFYSAFMVAEEVTVQTRRAGQPADTAILWRSNGDGTYSIEPTHRDNPGTTITLWLKEDARKVGAASPEDEENTEGQRVTERNYLDVATLRSIVKRHSDFLAYPVRFVSGSQEPETLNSGKAIWMRPASEVTDEEYSEFYKHIAPDWQDPLRRIVVSAEGATQFRALLFIPRHAPLDLMGRNDDGEGPDGLRLYARRVLIQTGCRDLVPEWLRFLRGVVDSEDLSLNVSREMLQKDRTVTLIRKAIVRRVLETLRHMKDDSPQDYALFWNQFGAILKEGILRDPDRKDAILDLCLFETTAELGEAKAINNANETEGANGEENPEAKDNGESSAPRYAPRTTLDGYMERMKNGQDAIWVLAGPDLETLRKSPHLEVFREKGVEVLLLNDPIDEWWVGQTSTIREKPLKHAGKGELELGSESERQQAKESAEAKQKELEGLLKDLGQHLKGEIREVRISKRLKNSAACLVGNPWDLSPQMEAALRASGREMPRSQRVLEVNPDHPTLQRLQAIHALTPEDPRIREAAILLHGQALLSEGALPKDPSEFASLLGNALEKALG
jgi:molecular chaperone HtpG